MTPPDFSDLRALYLNCTLKPTPAFSNTQALMDNAIAIMRARGVTVECARIADLELAAGVEEDMTRSDPPAPRDDWPELLVRVRAADILVLGTPLWLGEKSSLCQRVIERLYGQSGNLNEHGQSGFYGRVGGLVVTGNEDGIKHAAMGVLYSLQHVGFSIPPQADCGWIGEAGPGPNYADEGSGGRVNDFTRRNTTFMAHNLMHLAALLKRNGGFPAYGNSGPAWRDGEHFGHPDPPADA